MPRGRRKLADQQAVNEANALRVLPNIPPLDEELVPEWSPETQAALEELTPDEQRFVEYYTMGCNAAECYRRIRGVEYNDRDSDRTRIQGYKIRTRPRVDAAIKLAMKDAAFGAGMDREWMLQRLRVAVERAEACGGHNAQLVVGELIDRIAKLKGEYLPERQEITVTHDLSPAMKRFTESLEMAKRRISGEATPSIVRVVVDAEQEAIA